MGELESALSNFQQINSQADRLRQCVHVVDMMVIDGSAAQGCDGRRACESVGALNSQLARALGS